MSSSTAHERLEKAWRERGEGFSRHWASCTAQTRTRLLAAARDLLRKRVSGGRPQQQASDADGFLALCPELADAKLPRMAQGDMLAKLIAVRVDHSAACREHDMRYVGANIGGGGRGGGGGGPMMCIALNRAPASLVCRLGDVWVLESCPTRACGEAVEMNGWHGA